MLKLKQICYQPATAEELVLENISFQSKNKQPIIIYGPSGSGKTSLIEIISGLATPNKGSIYWNDQLIKERKRRSICGVVFQFPERHFIGLSISQELKLGHKRLSSEFQQEVLQKVGLGNISPNSQPEKLSGGQQRRLSLAVQLIRNPKILLLDEPTAGLDWSVRDEIIELIKKLSEEQLFIIITHEPDLFSHWKVSKYQLHNGVLNTGKK